MWCDPLDPHPYTPPPDQSGEFREIILGTRGFLDDRQIAHLICVRLKIVSL